MQNCDKWETLEKMVLNFKKNGCHLKKMARTCKTGHTCAKIGQTWKNCPSV